MSIEFEPDVKLNPAVVEFNSLQAIDLVDVDSTSETDRVTQRVFRI